MRDDSATERARREAREGVRFGRVAETDPFWNVITIRMRIRTPLPASVLVLDRGDAAARRLYRFAASILSGAGLISEHEAKRIVAGIDTHYPPTGGAS